MGEIKVDILLPYEPVAVQTEVVQAFFVFPGVHFLMDKQRHRLFICWINYWLSFIVVLEFSLKLVSVFLELSEISKHTPTINVWDLINNWFVQDLRMKAEI